MKLSSLFLLLPLFVLSLKAGALEETLLSTKTYDIAGEFASYDFNQDGNIAPSDWTFTTADGTVYQLLGDTSEANVAKVGVFGWKLLPGFTPNTPSFYLAFLSKDVDGDGSTKFDWVVIDGGAGAVYKLAGQNPTTKSFQYANTSNIKANVNRQNRKIEFSSTLQAAFTLTSASYSSGGIIDAKYSCQGSNISPQYSWQNTPATTTSFALIMDDETAPCGIGDQACKHWSVFNIASSMTSLSENAATSALTQGENYVGSVGYEGPCPPSKHTYKTTLYALNANMPSIQSGAALTRSQFEKMYKSYIVGSSTIEGTFTP